MTERPLPPPPSRPCPGAPALPQGEQSEGEHQDFFPLRVATYNVGASQNSAFSNVQKTEKFKLKLRAFSSGEQGSGPPLEPIRI